MLVMLVIVSGCDKFNDSYNVSNPNNFNGFQ